MLCGTLTLSDSATQRVPSSSDSLDGGSWLFEGFLGGSEVKASACNAGDLGSIPGSERSAGERIGYSLQLLGFPCGLADKKSAHNAGDLGLIPGLGRSSGEGNGNSLQYSCLEILMDGGAWWATVHGVAKSRTQLND